MSLLLLLPSAISDTCGRYHKRLVHLPSRVHLELPDVPELLGSSPSRVLPLASARLLLLLLPPRFRYGFLKVVGVPELLVIRDRNLEFITHNNICNYVTCCMI
jgi:hypothetical protein